MIHLDVYETLARVRLPGNSTVSWEKLEGNSGKLHLNASLGESTVAMWTNVNFNASVYVNLDECDDVGLMKWIGRLWVDIWIHEARERIRIDGEKILDPHTADGDERFEDITWLGDVYLGHTWTWRSFQRPPLERPAEIARKLGMTA